MSPRPASDGRLGAWVHDLTLDTTRNVPSANDRAFSQRAMLRITVTTYPEGVTVALEGRLAGPWVDEVFGNPARAHDPTPAAAERGR